MVAQVIAESLSEDEIMGLKEMFKSIDTDNSGTITFEELKAGLPKLGNLGIKISESEVRQLMEAVCFLLYLSLAKAHLFFCLTSCLIIFLDNGPKYLSRCSGLNL